jgi:hypothetical protein
LDSDNNVRAIARQWNLGCGGNGLRVVAGSVGATRRACGAFRRRHKAMLTSAAAG